MNLILSDVIATLQATMLGTSDYFERENSSDSIDLYHTMIKNGLSKLRVLSPLTLSHVLTLVADQQIYTGPDNIWSIKAHSWGQNQAAPWEDGFINRIPDVSVSGTDVVFSFAPTQTMLNSLGSRFQFFYIANYALSEEAQSSNVGSALEPLLLLLCQASAMEMLMIRGASKPIQVKQGVGSIKKAAPGEVFETLMTAAKHLASVR